MLLGHHVGLLEREYATSINDKDWRAGPDLSIVGSKSERSLEIQSLS